MLAYGTKGFKKSRTFRQDKGHVCEVAAFISRAAEGGSSPIPLGELVNATGPSFAAVESANRGGEIVHL